MKTVRHTDPPIVYAVRDRCAEIVMNRPDVSNAVDLPMAMGLAEAIERAADDERVDVVLLRGSGERFCVGGDLTSMAAAPDRAALVAQLADTAHRAVRAMDRLPKPIVAAVQ